MTCIIRANTVYGEKAMFLHDLYLSAKAHNGVLNYLEPEQTERNTTYVGEWVMDLFACSATTGDFAHWLTHNPWTQKNEYSDWVETILQAQNSVWLKEFIKHLLTFYCFHRTIKVAKATKTIQSNHHPNGCDHSRPWHSVQRSTFPWKSLAKRFSFFKFSST